MPETSNYHSGQCLSKVIKGGSQKQLVVMLWSMAVSFTLNNNMETEFPQRSHRNPPSLLHRRLPAEKWNVADVPPEIWGTRKLLLSSQPTAYLSQSPLFLIRSGGRRRAGHQAAKWWMCFGGCLSPGRRGAALMTDGLKRAGNLGACCDLVVTDRLQR